MGYSRCLTVVCRPDASGQAKSLIDRGLGWMTVLKVKLKNRYYNAILGLRYAKKILIYLVISKQKIIILSGF